MRQVEKDNPKQQRYLAALKVTRSDLLSRKIATTKYQGFQNDKEVLDYSWELFKDKIDQRVDILATPNNPQTKFNLRKFHEFSFTPRDPNDDDYDPPLTKQQIRQ